jgi:hypothetical protein
MCNSLNRIYLNDTGGHTNKIMANSLATLTSRRPTTMGCSFRGGATAVVHVQVVPGDDQRSGRGSAMKRSTPRPRRAETTVKATARERDPHRQPISVHLPRSFTIPDEPPLLPLSWLCPSMAAIGEPGTADRVLIPAAMPTLAADSVAPGASRGGEDGPA